MAKLKVRELNINTLEKDTIKELSHIIITGSKIELRLSESDNGKIEVIVHSTNGSINKTNITLGSGNLFEIDLDS